MCALGRPPTTKGLCVLILERTDDQFRIAAAVSQRMNTSRRRYRRRSSRTLRAGGRTVRTCIPWGNRPNTGPGPEAIPPVRPPLYSIHGVSRQLLLCSSAPRRLRSASNSPCPRPGSSSPGFLSRDPPAAARVKRAVPVHSSWADRFIKHHPRSARGMIMSQLNNAHALRPGPHRSQAPLKLH